ncbi:MAG: 30S ribosomal protein S1 [Chloroflexi bacterium]|nr:30S ribosomal protein S1 [Chloroflexota bacterium]
MTVQFNMGDDSLDFGALLDDYDYQAPQRGDLLEGIILAIDETEILVDVGAKQDAFVLRKDLERLDDSDLDHLQPGDDVFVEVLRPRDYEGRLVVSINKALERQDWERANELLESQKSVDVTVNGINRGGVLVEFGRLQGFVPQSHLTQIPRSGSNDKLEEAKRALIGETMPAKVIEVQRSRNRLILSEKLAQTSARQARMEELEVGQVITGRVVGLMNYGAFVDLGGVDGLIHISNLDKRYVGHPSDVLNLNDEVTVLIEGIDVERERISLNREVLLPDPWKVIEETYKEGDLASGTVTNVVDFGFFVGMDQGVEGLVHVSEMETYNTPPDQLVNVGDSILVRIIQIDSAEQRLYLSLDAVSVDEQAQWLSQNIDEALDGNEPQAEIDELGAAA